jgi:hypothetical protein
LDGTDLVSLAEDDVGQEIDSESSEGCLMSWTKNEKQEPCFTSRGYSFIYDKYEAFQTSRKGEIIQTVNINTIRYFIQTLNSIQNDFAHRGFCLFVGLLGLARFSKETVMRIKSSWADSTWKAKLLSYKAFADFISEDDGRAVLFDTPTGLVPLVLEFLQWCELEEGEFEVKEEAVVRRRFPSSEILIIKSNIRNLFDLAFGVKLGEVTILLSWSRSFEKGHKGKEKYTQAWDAGLLLDYIRTETTNIVEDNSHMHEFILLRTIALVAFFTILRPVELLNIELVPDQIFTEGCVVLATIKTSQTKFTRIFIPRIKDYRICPFFHLMRLLYLNKTLFNSPSKEIWVNSSNGKVLSSFILRKNLQIIMKKAGIQDTFTAYSYKHAAISFPVKSGVSESEIDQACRFKFNKINLVISQYYAVSETQKKIHLLLASTLIRNMGWNKIFSMPWFLKIPLIKEISIEDLVQGNKAHQEAQRTILQYKNMLSDCLHIGVVDVGTYNEGVTLTQENDQSNSDFFN